MATESKPAGGETQPGPDRIRSSAGPVFGTLAQVFDDVWWAWGTVRFAPGVTFPRNMTIVRERGELIVIHPVLMPAEEQAKLEALGPIKHLVRLGAFHGMDDARYAERYGATLWAPPGVDLPAGVTGVRELRPGGELPIAGATLLAFERSKRPETVMLVPRHGGVLLACDSVQNWESTAGCSLLGKAVARLMGYKGRACIGPAWRKICEPKDGEGFRPALERLLELDFRHALSGHGAPMKDTAKDDLRAQVRRIYGS